MAKKQSVGVGGAATITAAEEGSAAVSNVEESCDRGSKVHQGTSLHQQDAASTTKQQ